MVWPTVGPWIEHVVDRFAYFTVDDIVKEIFAGKARLWVACEGSQIVSSAITVTHLTKRGRHCEVLLMAGGTRKQWLPLLDDIEEWARRDGCKLMRNECRPGMAKLLKGKGYKARQFILEKEL